MNPFEKLAAELKRLETGYREESYYRSLCNFLESYATDREYLHMINVVATNNPSSESIGEGIGFPDIEVRQNRRLIGYIEVKSPNQNLDSPAFSAQFNKYKESLENIIFTNFKKWVLYTWDKDGKPQKTEEAEWDYQVDRGAEKLKRLLTVFFEGQSYQARTPHQLAIALARKTKLLSQQVKEAIIKDKPEKKLIDLKNTFEKTLIQNISDHQFANIYAETITYSLFLAMLQHFEKGSSEEFTLRTAVDYLPKSVPIFRDLYQLTGGTVEPITQGIHKATEVIIEQLKFADIERIYKKLVEHKPGEDPVIQFYEPFLSEYDPKEREARGVYYTPKPVVDYMVRGVDHILKTKFDKPKGLGDQSVQVLDPATGTGTFLQSVIQNIYADIEKKNKPLGEQAIHREFNDVVSNHILKHIYGFELLVAPYAVAHLKLTLELERLGFNFSMTSGDQDKDNDRLKIYLANTLDDPSQQPKSLFGFDSITEESNKARLVKKDSPILVIVGNPPYSGISLNPVEKTIYEKGKKRTIKTWIGDLIEDYKYTEGNRLTGKYFNERKHWLGDDYVKFIRFAQWKIEKEGRGIIALVTNNGYLDNPTFRAMRYQLIKAFDEIYVFDLHGSSVRGDTTAGGLKDENVFSIRTGVSISIFIKNKGGGKSLLHSELYGNRKLKYNFLLETKFSETKWEKISVHGPAYNFVEKKAEEEFNNLTSVLDLFLLRNTGIQSSRDDLVYDFDKEKLLKKLLYFFDLKNSDDQVRSRFFSGGKRSSKFNRGDTRGWSLSEIRRKNIKFIDKICLSQYRPFDERFLAYEVLLLDWPRLDIMNHILKGPNLFLIMHRNIQKKEYNHFFVSDILCDMHNLDSAIGSYVFPLYLYNDTSAKQESIFEQAKRRPSVNLETVKKFSEKIDLKFIDNGKGDLQKTFGPESVFYYAYSVFHSPTYRRRYTEQLKVNFPRLPITSNKNVFKKLIQYGNELVNLHLLGGNPFDKSKTIFDDTSKWNTKLGGEKPKDMEDWKVMEVRHDEKTKRVYINSGQYFEGIEKEVWEFMIGGYQVLDKWLKDRKKAGRTLSYDDQVHYMKIIVSLRETIRIMKDIDEAIPNWPIK